MLKRLPAILILLSGLAGCTSDTPYLDSRLGLALETGKAAQTINTTQASPDAQVNSRELRKGTESYMSGAAATPALQGVATQGGSSTSR